MSSTAGEANKLSSYRKNKLAKNADKNAEGKPDVACHGCGSKDHGSTFADRKEKCPAWGKTSCPCKGPNHFKRVCRKGGVAPATPANAVEEGDASALWLNQVRSQVRRKQNYSLDLLSFDKQSGKWIETGPNYKDLPVRMVVDTPSYTKLATRWQKVHGARDLKTCDQNSTADTGATVTCGGKHLLKVLGLKVTDCHLVQTYVLRTR